MGEFPHTFSSEERRRGGHNRAAAIREQRERAQQEASQELARLAVKAVGRLERAMDGETMRASALPSTFSIGFWGSRVNGERITT